MRLGGKCSTAKQKKRTVYSLEETHIGKILKETVEAAANDKASIAALLDLLLRHGAY